MKHIGNDKDPLHLNTAQMIQKGNRQQGNPHFIGKDRSRKLERIPLDEKAFKESWLQELLAYLSRNREIVTRAVDDSLPGVTMTPVEATYLAWLNVSELPIPNPCAFFEKHGVGLSDGIHFGSKGFLRLNFGCPKSVLEKGNARMKRAIETL